MVRRIRECETCGKRFVTNKPDHCDHCNSKISTTNDDDESKLRETFGDALSRNKTTEPIRCDSSSSDDDEEGDRPLVDLLDEADLKNDNVLRSRGTCPEFIDLLEEEDSSETVDPGGSENEKDRESILSNEDNMDNQRNSNDGFIMEMQNYLQIFGQHGRSQPESDDPNAATNDEVLKINESKNVDLLICMVCGATLRHIKEYGGRLNHIKRCSKKHGVTAKDVRLDDDIELFQEIPQKRLPTDNPYTRKNDWHGKTSKSLSLGDDPQPLSINQMLMAGAKRAQQIQKIQKQNIVKKVRSRFNKNSFNTTANTSCPAYKKIPGTDFVCDGFHYANQTLTKNYFLSHFHSDHYGGITKSWTTGIIYCSVVTANLVHKQLGVDRQYLHPLSLYTPTVIESRGKAATVTLLHANHCPGAVMFLFEVEKRVMLHVGDFRWNTNIMSSQAPLRPFCRKLWSNASSERRIDDIFLDTTYCDPQYALPSQEDCITAAEKVAMDEIQIARREKKRILMLFGAYTIGKEIVYLSVAKRLGLKVYVDNRRYRVLAALNWPKDDLAILTKNPEESIIWVVPLGHVNMKRMSIYISIRRGRFCRDFDRVIGFRPTGWSLSSRGKKRNGIIGSASRGVLTVYSVPYSEHSSFPELVECLECLNPKRIIPTVSVSKSQQQVDLLMKHWKAMQATFLLEE
jgi:DNA cross-link repair 1A protein